MKDEMERIHKKLAVDLFNQTWNYLDSSTRSEETDFLMIHTAHASLYHWYQVGDALNHARGEWMVSHVYGVLQLGESALYHGKRSLHLCLENNIGDFDLAFAYETIARAYKVMNHMIDYTHYYDLAVESGQSILQDEDREYFFQQLQLL